ncbi:double-strand break repair protein MRE11 [Fopius arisanus]|uniref:Double-strand break repair protein n=1 Tax=Fopius arisanus TaxID=64838 RepID=A0A0C9R9I9_9HYME|nr:PREDICTED: double-strand break repair protein MRE11 [Fopius arisanus]
MADAGQRTSNSDRFKILVATDCHLGYEVKTKRAQDSDSIITFEEILKTAQERDVDFILLAGDMFHDPKPSQRIILESLNLLKKYCAGKRAIPFELLSNPKDIFPNKMVNYEDENMNISIPVFSIHGNHDNPNFESTGTLDLLMASGLVNYFGKWSNLQQIKVTPMIFQKGETLVAIYGVGYLSEQRLSRLFREGQVHFLRPSNIGKCFNILVLHQNRARHSENDYIEENRFPPWFDLIIWGHEHECRISPEVIQCREGSTYDICQPGSSVATSLSEGESVPKHVGLLLIQGENYRMRSIKLKTVRPFFFGNISLSEIMEKGYCDYSPEGIVEYIDDYIKNTAIPAGKKMLSGHEDQPKRPLIRLRIFYTKEYQNLDTSHLSHKYNDLVANPGDMLIFKKEKAPGEKKVKNDHFADLTEDIAECFRHDTDDPQEWTKTVQSGITKFFEQNDYQLQVMSLAGINEAVHRCVVSGDSDAFAQVMEHQIKKSIDYLMTKDGEANAESVLAQLQMYRAERKMKDEEDEELKEVQDMLNNPAQRSVPAAKAVDVSPDDGSSTAPARGHSRGKSTTAKTPRASSRGRGTRGRGRGMATLDSIIVRHPTPIDKDDSGDDITAFKRFAAPSSQRANPNTQTTKSQKKPLYIDSSDSE